MNNHTNIVWLSSFPKSGNTWVRIFIESLLYNTYDINHLRSSFQISDLHYFSKYLGVDPLDLTETERKKLQPKLYKQIFDEISDTALVKTHNALEPFHYSLQPFRFIYLVRNPLDVCISLSEHMGCSYDQAVQYLNQNFKLASRTTSHKFQERQDVLSWIDHVESWNVESESGLIIRYEDLINDPLKYFKLIAQYMGIKKPDTEIIQAIENCSFSKLQNRERMEGFHEKSIHAKSFFSKGIIGRGEQLLNEKQIKSILDVNKKMMLAYGYRD